MYICDINNYFSFNQSLYTEIQLYYRAVSTTIQSTAQSIKHYIRNISILFKFYYILFSFNYLFTLSVYFMQRFMFTIYIKVILNKNGNIPWKSCRYYFLILSDCFQYVLVFFSAVGVLYCEKVKKNHTSICLSPVIVCNNPIIYKCPIIN